MPRSPLGLPVLRLIHYVCMPSPLPRRDRWNGFAHYCSIDFGLPQITDGSAPALSVSRPAQRSLVLQPADSPSRLMRPFPPEASAASLPPPLLRLLPGGAIQFPGGSFFPLWTNAFSRRTVNAWLRKLSRLLSQLGSRSWIASGLPVTRQMGAPSRSKTTPVSSASFLWLVLEDPVEHWIAACLIVFPGWNDFVVGPDDVLVSFGKLVVLS